jgi:hypothetical protein
VHGDPLIGWLASPDTDPEAVARISHALATQESITTDAIQLATDDRRFHVHLDVQPVLGEDGYVENYIAIETDITARVEIEQQLRRAKSRGRRRLPRQVRLPRHHVARDPHAHERRHRHDQPAAGDRSQ